MKRFVIWEESLEYSEIILDELVPSSIVAITESLIGELAIPARKKYYYKLVIKWNDLRDVDFYDAKEGLNNRALSEPTNVAPVINLTYDYVMQMTGDGTSSNVFRVG